MRARLGVAARGSVHPVAAPPSGRATVRDRVQDSAGRIGSATRKGLAADGRLHGCLRRHCGLPSDLQPQYEAMAGGVFRRREVFECIPGEPWGMEAPMLRSDHGGSASR